jgi:hypothetical protein
VQLVDRTLARTQLEEWVRAAASRGLTSIGLEDFVAIAAMFVPPRTSRDPRS